MYLKSNALKALKEWVVFVDNQTGHKLKSVSSDNGSEWINSEVEAWCTAKGILWQRTSPYTSLHNGRVERMNRMLMEKMWALFSQQELPMSLWPFVFKAAVFLINLTPNKDHIMLYQLIFSKSTTQFMQLLKVFGCLAWVFIPKLHRQEGKTGMHVVPAILLG